MPSKKKDDVVIKPNKLKLEPFKKLKVRFNGEK